MGSRSVPIPGISYVELRTAYVRYCFGGPDLFGLADIGNWLAVQAQSDHPDVPMWESYVTRHHFVDLVRGNESWLLALNSACHDFRIQDREAYWRGDEDAAYQRCKALDPNQYGVLKALRSQPILLARNQIPPTITSYARWTGEKDAKGVETMDVVWILLATWGSGGRHSLAARQYLCGSLATIVRRERTRCEFQFDEAIAVSKDGTEVLSADRIVFFSPDRGSWRHVFPESSFQDRKLLLFPPARRYHNTVPRTETEFLDGSDEMSDFCAQGVIAHLVRLGIGQAVVTTIDDACTFFCDIRLVEGALPVGGTEIL